MSASTSTPTPTSKTNTAPEIHDDKTPLVIPFILNHLRAHLLSSNNSNNRPFIIGLNGVQGVGKTTLVKDLATTLRREEGLETLVCSIDDFYLTREDQEALAKAHPGNALVQVRGEPGTHDIPLATTVLTALLANAPTSIPQYDKSAHSGLGDRLSPELWPRVNQPNSNQSSIQVVILEGWCVGFRPLASAAEVAARRNDAPSRTLRRHALEHLVYINDRLADYNILTNTFDAFVHVDAADTGWVYDWRLEQEVRLRAERGAGMTDDEVVRFVDAYYPAYELFTDRLRSGLFADDKPRCQLRLVVGKDRRVKQSIII